MVFSRGTHSLQCFLQSYTQEVYCRQQIQKITGKNQPSGYDIKIFIQNIARTGDPDTNNKNIQPGYKNGKVYRSDNEKN